MNFNEILGNWLDKVGAVDWGQAVAVFITGLVVVFSTLIVLVIVFWGFGKIVNSLGNSKKPKDEAKKKVSKSESAPQNIKKAVAKDEITDDIVAAITGAISAILSEEGNNSSFVIRSIKRIRKPSFGWRNAGILENIRQF